MTRQMGLPILPMVPAPAAGECIYGYLRRLADANGFASVTRAMSVFGLGGLCPLDDPRRKSADPWKRLSRLTGLPLASFEDMRWQRLTNPFTGYKSDVRVLGARLRSGLVDSNAFRFCPACLAENAIFKTAWLLRYCVACPRHGTALLDACRTCGSRFRTARDPYNAGPWDCQCGSDLRKQQSDPAGEPAVRLSERIHIALGAAREVGVGGAGSGRLDLGSMPLNDVLMLVHVLGLVATTDADHDSAIRVGNPPFPFAVVDPPNSVEIASLRIEAAFGLLDDWPGAFHTLLERLAHRFPASTDRRQDKRAFGSRVGKMLLYPPCDLSGRPLPPIYDEVHTFCCERLGLKLSKRRHHTLDGLSRKLYPVTNISTLARSLGVSSNDGLLNGTFRRVLETLSPEERDQPVKRLSELVTARVHGLYKERMSSVSSTEAARILEGEAHDRSLVGWDHPLLLTPLHHLNGLGKRRLRSYAAKDIAEMQSRLRQRAGLSDAPDGTVSLRAHAMRRALGITYTKTDLLIDIFAGRLPIHSGVERPTLADLHVDMGDVERCQLLSFIRRCSKSNPYFPWAVIVRRLKGRCPEIEAVDQWALHRLVRREKLRRLPDLGGRRWRYNILDILSIFGGGETFETSESTPLLNVTASTSLMESRKL